MAFIAPVAAAVGGAGSLATIAGTAISTISAVQSARASAQAERESIFSTDQERQARIIEQKRLNKQKLGKAIVSFASSGVDVSEGSPLLVLEETLALGERDIDAINQRAESQIRSSQLREKAFNRKASNAVLSGVFDSASTILTSRKKQKLKAS